MQQDAPSLIDRLRSAAEAWSSATGRTTGALSALVTNHGSFFDRLGSTRAGFSTTTLEKFAQFFADRDNWPAGRIEGEAAEFVHVVIGSTPEPSASPDSCSENIGHVSKKTHSEAPAEPAAVPAGEADPVDPSNIAGASGRSPGTAQAGEAALLGGTLSGTVPGDLFEEKARA